MERNKKDPCLLSLGEIQGVAPSFIRSMYKAAGIMCVKEFHPNELSAFFGVEDRTQTGGKYKEMTLLGGKREKHEQSPLYTAVREFVEETGEILSFDWILYLIETSLIGEISFQTYFIMGDFCSFSLSLEDHLLIVSPPIFLLAQKKKHMFFGLKMQNTFYLCGMILTIL